MVNDEIVDNCDECEGFFLLYAMLNRTPCPGCGRGDPNARMFISNNPLVTWMAAQPDPAAPDGEGA